MRLEIKAIFFQIVWPVSNDRVACHIFLPDYRGSLSEGVLGLSNGSTLPALFAFNRDKTKR